MGKVTQKYNMTRISTRDRGYLEEVSDTDRLKDIRAWLNRLKVAHTEGYRLIDTSIETVVSNGFFLLHKLDERNRAS